MTLLEKAKTIHNSVKPLKDEEITDQHIELIIAFLNNEITIRQCAGALNQKYPGNFTQWLGKAIKILYGQGKIQINK